MELVYRLKIKVIHHIKKLKTKRMIISTDAEKAPDKTSQFPIKISSLERERNILTLIKGIPQKPTTNNTLNGDRLNAFPHHQTLLLNTVPEGLANAIRQV